MVIHNSRFRARNFSRQCGESKQAGSYYWTMDCFQNIRRGVIIADFERGISGGKLLLEWIVFRIDWNNQQG